jgi:hypothetical protein
MRFMRYIQPMPRPLTFPIKKLIGFNPDLWEQVRDYRFDARLNTESDAVRQLLEIGLRHAPASKKPRSWAGLKAQKPARRSKRG